MIGILCAIDERLDHILRSGAVKPFLRDLGKMEVTEKHLYPSGESGFGFFFGIDERNGTLFFEIIYGLTGHMSVHFKLQLPDGFIIQLGHLWEIRSDGFLDKGGLTINSLEFNIEGSWMRAEKIQLTKKSIEDQFGYNLSRLSIHLPYTVKYSE